MLTSFDDLFTRYSVRPNGILHLGASDDGRELPHYAKACPGGPILLVEALPKVCARLEKKLTHPNMRAICACVSDKDGEERDFHVANNAGQSSSLLSFGTHTVEHPSVQFIGDTKLVTTRVDTLLAKELAVMAQRPWFGNIDLQGAELMALRGFGPFLEAFSWLYIEVNKRPLYQGAPMIGELDAFLAPHGFNRRETWWFQHSNGQEAGWGDAIWTRR